MDSPQNLEQIEYFVEIGLALARQKDQAALLEQILQSAQNMSGAAGGTIYRMSEHGSLQFATLLNQSLGLHQGGTSDCQIAFPDIPLLLDGQPNHSAVVAISAFRKEPLAIDDVYQSPFVNQQRAREFDEKMQYRTQSMFAVPLLDHQREVTGVLQLVNCLDQTGQVQPFPKHIQRIVIALSSLAAMVMTNQQLVTDLETLFNALTRLLANTIDEKSPYTAGHCRRVPAITMMLTKACSEIKQGPLAAFSMNDADVHELSVAAWLHDCGKITTPEYVKSHQTSWLA